MGAKVAERLGRLGLRTVRDVAEYIPRGYLDWREAAGFAGLAAGEEATVRCMRGARLACGPRGGGT